MPDESTQSYGQKAVGLSFNPSEDEDIAYIKELSAAFIDICDAKRKAEWGNSKEQVRLFSVAITEAQTAQMWAVKALTWKD